MLKKIDTKKAPAAIGPYSQAIVCGNMLFTSGQIPIDPATGDIHGADITEQAEQVMKNLAAVLEEAGTTFENAVKTTCFLTDMGDFAAFNAVYGKFLLVLNFGNSGFLPCSFCFAARSKTGAHSGRPLEYPAA